ncbi:hypothetical protein [Solibacillus daqui]|uniref:hypothetical protein n=1 Tax=Solibacillus daqui TaxID=2912187 RepID=UPI002365F7C7|nr:hypothetical protein [Solibacillus daqui]
MKVFIGIWSVLITQSLLVLMYLIGYAFLSAVSINPNTATIISGLLSMVGGAFGALGAYMVATYQMKKQFEKQNSDRRVEYQIAKLNETLDLAFEFKKTLISCHENKRNILVYLRLPYKDDQYIKLFEKIKTQIETLDLMYEMFDRYEMSFNTPIDLEDIGTKVLQFKSDFEDLINFMEGKQLSFMRTNIDLEDQQKNYLELSGSIARFIESLKEDIQNLIILK